MTSTEWLTFILIVVTAFYAWQTYKTVNVMESANEANSRPVISVSVVNDSPEGVSFVYLIIRNTGKGLARNISFSISGDELKVENLGERERTFADIGMLKNGIKVLAPSELRRTWLLSTIGRVDEILSKEVKISVDYSNADLSKRYKDEFVLDFASLTRIQLGHDSIRNIDKELEKIRKIMEKKR